MALRKLLLFEIFFLLFNNVHLSFTCKYLSNSHKISYVKKLVVLTILHTPPDNITISCNGLKSLIDSGENTILKLNVTRSRQLISTLNFTEYSNDSFDVSLGHELFNDAKKISTFEFVYFDCQAYILMKDMNGEDAIKTLYHFKIYIIPEILESFIVDDKNLLGIQNVTFAQNLCGDDIAFGIDDSIKLDKDLNVYGKFNDEIFLSIPIQTAENSWNRTYSKDHLKLFVLPQHLMLMLMSNATIYKAKLGDDKISTFHNTGISFSAPPALVTRSVYCPITNSFQHLFESVIVISKNTTNENHSLVNLLPYPYVNSTLVSIGIQMVDALKISDVWLDFGRKNMLILIKHEERVQEIKVFSIAGALKCRPWSFQDHIDVNYQFKTKLNRLFLVPQNRGDSESFSFNGGCTWYPYFQKLPTFLVEILFPHTMLFRLKASNITKAFSNIGVPLIWTDYGVLLLESINSEPDFPFFINKQIPESTNPMRGRDMMLTRNQNESYTMTLSSNPLHLPTSWKDTHIISFKESISCLVEEIITNEARLICRSLSKKEMKENITMERFTWFNEDFYHSQSHCVSCVYKNDTLIHLQTPIERNISHVIFKNPLLQVPVLKLDSYTVTVPEESGLNITLDSPVTLCFYEQFKSLQSVLMETVDLCPLTYEIIGVNSTLIYLDVTEHVTITVRITLQATLSIHEEIPQMPWLHAQLSNPNFLGMRIKRRKTLRQEEMQIIFQQTWVPTTLNLLTIAPMIFHKHCPFRPQDFQILNTCPPNKKVILEYPDSITSQQFSIPDLKDSNGIIRVFDLPTNYQPPSVRGRGIPQTKHVYNADPSVSLHYKKYLDDQIAPVFKQCKGVLERSKCNCTKAMTTSSKISQSDCISKVYRLIYREKFVPRLLLQHGEKKVIFSELMQLIELNSRTDYTLLDSVNSEGITELISIHRNTSIELKGSGLYHFKVDVVKKNVSFCNFQTEFLVYVDGAPLPYPVDDVIRACTAFVFGFILLALFLYQYLKLSKYSD